MKISKKLISAIVMLTLSFVMLVTSSFAWFSMNTNVKATGMTVSAKADQLFLQIAKANNGAGLNDTEALVEVILNSEKEEMAPVTAAKSATPDDPDTPDTNERELAPLTATDNVLAANSVKWFISTSDSPDSATAKVDYVDVTSAIDDDTQAYWLINSFDIRLNPAAGLTTAANPLTCSVALSQSSTDEIAKAVSVLVVCGENAMLFSQGASGWTTIGKQLTAGAFSNPAAGYVKVDVYVFFDGENANCKTNNVTTSSYGVDVYFSVANAVA